jgi:hypothetical protein
MFWGYGTLAKYQTLREFSGTGGMGTPPKPDIGIPPLKTMRGGTSPPPLSTKNYFKNIPVNHFFLKFLVKKIQLQVPAFFYYFSAPVSVFMHVGN